MRDKWKLFHGRFLVSPQGRARAVRWTVRAVVLLFLGLWLGLSLTGGQGPQDYLERHDGIWEVLRTAQLMRAGDTAPVEVTLPHQLHHAHSGDVAQYTLALPVRPEHSRASPLGLCVPRWSLSAEVWLDGVRLSGAAPGIEAIREYTRPHFVALPAGLSVGPHTLTLRVHPLAELDPGLSEIWFGDGDDIRRGCARFAEAKRDRGYGALFMLGLMGVIGLLLWAQLQERSARYFALMALGWALHFAHLNEDWWPMSLDHWSLGYFISRVAFGLPMMLFCLSFAQPPRPKLERALVWIYVLAIAVLCVLPSERRDEWLSAFALCNLVLASYCLWLLLRATWHTPGLSGRILAATLAFVIVSHVLDLARWLGFIPFGAVSLSYVSVPLLSLSFGLLLVERLFQHVQREARAAQELREQIELQRQRIAADYAQMQQQHAQLAILEERRRIVRDMHDGLGAQLVSARTLLDGRQTPSPEVLSALIDRSLWDLRSVIDVLEQDTHIAHDDDPISTLLGSLRWRLEPVLRAKGIALLWRVDALPPQFLRDDAQRLHLLRFVQEVFANVLKHSGATQVAFTMQHDVGAIRLHVQDDGRGIDLTQQKSGVGVGMRNLARRAQALGAHWSIDSPPGQGVGVTLVWDWTGRD